MLPEQEPVDCAFISITVPGGQLAFAQVISAVLSTASQPARANTAEKHQTIFVTRASLSAVHHARMTAAQQALWSRRFLDPGALLEDL